METTTKTKKSGVLWLITIASFIIVVAGLKAAQPILVPFLFGIFLAVLGSVPLAFLRSIKIPKVIAITMVLITFILVFYGLFAVLSNSFESFIRNLPQYIQKMRELTAEINNWLIAQGQKQLSDYILPALQPESIREIITKTIGQFFSAVSSVLVVFLVTTFVLNEATEFKNKLEIAFGKGIDVKNILGISYDVQKYLAIKTVTSVSTGVAIAFWTWLMGLDYPLLWGFLATILNYIPVIGSIIASIPAIMLSLMTASFSSTVVLTIGYIILNFTISNFIEPILMGRRLGLSVLVIFVSLVFWGWIWGPAGALMAVPLTMIAKIFLEHNEDLRWLAVFISHQAKPKEVNLKDKVD